MKNKDTSLKNIFKNKFRNLWENIKIVFKFAINDLKKRYSGSIGGFIWAYVQPLVAILVFWFVFEKGFRNSPVEGTPFILWLVPAYIAWTFANDAISQSTNVLFEYSFLVKKVKFNMVLLPAIKVAVALIVHLFFILFTYVLYWIYGYAFNFAWLQVFYYSFCLSMFLIGISWLVSSLSVFWKDIGQIVNIFLQIGFWLCPIFWNPDAMNEDVVKLLKINPLYYIVQGYRTCFIGNYGFWNYYNQTMYFWGLTILFLVGGYFIFKRLSKHYSDLL